LGLGFSVYNTLENACNKGLNEGYKTLFKMLKNDYYLGFGVWGLGFRF